MDLASVSADCFGVRVALPIFTVLAAVACGPPSETLDPWPFTVETVVLSCEAHAVGRLSVRRVFVVAPDGRRYAANGSAAAVAPLTDAIQSHYDTRAVIERGLALCDGGSGPVRLRAPATPPGAPLKAPTVHIERSELMRETVFFSIESETIVRGERPKLTLVCGGRQPPGLQVSFGADPQVGVPLRGVFAAFAVDGGRAERLEMSTGMGRVWLPREQHAAESRIIQRFLAGQELAVDPPAAYTPGERVTWRRATLGTHVVEARRLCIGGTAGSP